MNPLRSLLTKSLTLNGFTRRDSGIPSWANDGWDIGWNAWRQDREAIEHNFEGYVSEAVKSNGIVFSCLLVRLCVFAQAKFRYQNQATSQLFGDPSLMLFERPWVNGTSVDLLARMEMMASSAGNYYGALREPKNKPARIRNLRPDWTTIVTGSPSDDPFDLDAEPIGYFYQPPGRTPVLLSVDKVAHYAPIPDPDAQWRGMSWITPVVREIEGDSAATKHKLKFFQNGTTSNFVVSYDAGLNKDQFLEYVAAFKQAHEGATNAYKTIHLGGGADVQTVGADMKQLDFKVVQGGGETRIAAASGVGAVIAQLSEGLAGSSLNAGNYAASKERFGDVVLEHLWPLAAASLEKFVTPPDGATLTFDRDAVPFLKPAQTDASDIRQKDAATMSTLISAGYDPDSVTAAISAGDLRLLTHTGMTSVQLQPPVVVPDDTPTLDPQLVEAVGALIRAGFKPQAALTALGLPAIEHTGLEPITLQPEDA